MAQSAVQNQRVYVQKEATYGTIPNSTGAATVANADAVLFESLNLGLSNALIVRPDKTPGYGEVSGVAGHRGASFTLSGTLCPSGTAGTKPDWDEIYEAAFGAAATVVASTSVTYNIGATSPSLSIWEIWEALERVGFGGVVDQIKFSLGDGFARVEVSGPMRWAYEKAAFSSQDTTGKGGLTAWPTAPMTPTFNGTGLTTFQGSATLDGNAYTTVRSAEITIQMARTLPADVIFAGAYPGLPSRGRRKVTVSVSMTDDDTANLLAIKNKANLSKATAPMIFVCGSTAGNIATFNLPRVILDPAGYVESGANLGINFSGQAFPSTALLSDEMTLAFT